jgi:hypothetical protein
MNNAKITANCNAKNMQEVQNISFWVGTKESRESVEHILFLFYICIHCDSIALDAENIARSNKDRLNRLISIIQ